MALGGFACYSAVSVSAVGRELDVNSRPRHSYGTAIVYGTRQNSCVGRLGWCFQILLRQLKLLLRCIFIGYSLGSGVWFL